MPAATMMGLDLRNWVNSSAITARYAIAKTTISMNQQRGRLIQEFDRLMMSD